MLFQVEALLESLSEAGTAVDLATQAAFKNLRTTTLKKQQEAFATQAGKGRPAQPKIAWSDVSRLATHVSLFFLTICEIAHHRVVQVDTGSSSSAKKQPLAAITSGSTDDLLFVPSVAKKTVAPPPPPAADETPGEWIEAFDKAR